MKKVLLKGGKVVVEEISEVGRPQKGEIRLVAAASAISTGTESAQLVGGSWNADNTQRLGIKALNYLKEKGIWATVKKIQERMDQSTALGYSAAGVIESCGPDVSGFSPGDRVAVSGVQFANHAETILASSRLAVRIPTAVTMEEAATCAIGAIALQGVRRLSPQVGESVAVIGLGLVGQITAQILRASGARVIGIEKDSERTKFAKERGWIDEIGSNASGLDGAIITAHAPNQSQALELALKVVRRRARIVVVGDVGLGVSRELFYQKDLELAIATSYGPGRYDANYEERGQDYPQEYVRWTAQRNMECYLDLIATKRIQISPLIQAVYPVEEASKAYQAIEGAKGGKPLLTLLSYQDSTNGERSKETKASPAVALKTDRIRVGIIGAGSFVQSTHVPILSQISDYSINAVCTKHPERAHNLAKQLGAKSCADAKEIINDPNIDLVLIATRHNTHAQLAVQAIEAGKAVYLEKPMALNVDELESIVSAYAKNPVPFLVGFNRRYSPLARRLATELKNQPKPWVLQYRVKAEPLPADHWALSEEGGGRIVGEACHMLDLISYLYDSLPTGVQALGASGDKETPYHQSFSVNLSFDGDKIANLNYTPSQAQNLGKERIELITPKTTFVLDNFRTLEFGTAAGRTHRLGSEQVEKGFKQEWLQMRNYVLGKARQPKSDFNHWAEITKLTFLINDLAKGIGQA